ncbi:MAG: ATP-binding protein [Desulfitobacteriaceae bacterium]
MTETTLTRKNFERLALLMNGLTVYKNLRKDRVVDSLHRLLTAFAEGQTAPADFYRRYHDFCSLAVEYRWPDYLADLILEDENPFSITSAKKGLEGLNTSLKALAVRDLTVFQALGKLNSQELKTAASRLWPEQGSLEGEFLSPETWPEWENIWTDELDPTWLLSLRLEARNRLSGSAPVEEVMEFLAQYHRQMGYGTITRYLAFRWSGKASVTLPGLTGIPAPDLVRQEQLFGLEREMKIVRENTEYFLAGHTANNMILYGNRGTGKSSAVKSLLDTYGQQGLRLVELAKNDLGDFRQVVQHMVGCSQKFIIFVDDLSFDDTEPEYKALKTVLEGGLEAKPSNVLIYATSNRRHLIKENFSERQGDEVHARDTLEEKLSLADRFGITVTFPSPDQQGYLKIVGGLASQRGLQVESSELSRLALRWEMMHNGRSGRTARQFVDYLEASLATSGRG